jgi:thioredoxin reductase (NADPH)
LTPPAGNPGTNNIPVVGGGPAGIAAAVQLKRSGLVPVLFCSGEPGGLLRNANLVENYLGFPGGVTGKELVALFLKQLAEHDISIRREEVLKIGMAGEGDVGYAIRTDSGTTTSPAVIVATGTVPKKAGIPGEDDLPPDRIHYDVADIDTTSIDGGTMLVIGGGDAAFDYALNLGRGGAKVMIAFRADAPICLPLLMDIASRDESIVVRAGETVDSLEDVHDGVKATIEGVPLVADGVVVAVGREPNVKIIDGYSPPPRCPLDMEPDGFPGLFLAGDVRWGRYRQATIAAGDGLLAAMKAAEYLGRR